MYLDRGKYLYQAIWTPQGARRVYVGYGPTATLAANLDAARRQERAAEVDERRRMRAKDRHELRQLDAEFQALRMLVHVALLVGGYRQHRRQWYRLTVAGDDMTEAITKATPTEAEIRQLVERVNTAKPTPADLAQLRAYLAATPDAPLRALSAGAVSSAIITDAKVGEAQQVVIGVEVQRLRADLGYDDAPPLERGLIEHICTCWLRMQLAEMTLTSKTSGNHTAAAGVYFEKRVEMAQRRYLRALGALAKLRQMLPHNLQVNIANGPQQVNNRIEA